MFTRIHNWSISWARCIQSTHWWIYFLIIGIQPLSRSGQRLEFSQETGMALVRCILGKFLGVVCHCFPPLFRCSHFSPPGASTSATTWEIPAEEVGTVGEECCPVILPKWRLPRHLRDLLHAANLRHGTDGFTSPPKEGVLRIFFRP